MAETTSRREFLKTAFVAAFVPGCLSDTRRGGVHIDPVDTHTSLDAWTGSATGVDAMKPDAADIDPGIDYSRPPCGEYQPPKDCIYDPAEELTDPDLIKIYKIASDILDEIVEVLENASERSDAQSCGGGGGIGGGKTVNASSGGKSVNGISNCREFSRSLYNEFQNICTDSPLRRGSVSLQKGEYVDGFKQNLNIGVAEVIDSEVETLYNLQSVCNGPTSPSTLKKTIITDAGHDTELKDVNTQESYKVMLDLRARVNQIMEKYGIDNL